MDAYDEFPWYKRAFYSCCRCCGELEYQRMRKRYIGGNWPSPDISILPENIQWDNMKYSNVFRTISKLIVNLFILAVLLGSFFSILGIQDVKNKRDNPDA